MLGCNIGCLDDLRKENTVHCVINPETGEKAERAFTKADTGKIVAVIKAGPGGLFAAIAAAQRGDHVTVYETADCRKCGKCKERSACFLLKRDMFRYLQMSVLRKWRRCLLYRCFRKCA